MRAIMLLLSFVIPHGYQLNHQENPGASGATAVEASG
jgi:hypothetical protein